MTSVTDEMAVLLAIVESVNAQERDKREEIHFAYDAIRKLEHQYGDACIWAMALRGAELSCTGETPKWKM